MLVGRHREQQALDRLLEAARRADGGALVLRGEAGIGKTALLDYAVGRADGFRVLRAAGAEAEAELHFAALVALCGPVLPGIDQLPAPQREALGTALGLSGGEAPTGFLVALGLLNLLAEAAEATPILCAVDDAQWLDDSSASALGFVARRLQAERLAFLFAVRDPEPAPRLRGLPMLVLRGLDPVASRELLSAAVPGPLDPRVRERLVAETRGNPLALLELPYGLTPDQLAGGFGLPTTLPLTGRIEESYRRRLRDLPPDTQRVLLVAAADPTGDPALLQRAAERLGTSLAAAAAAEQARLLHIDSRVRFYHPLVRATVYRDAPVAQRLSVHRALGEATDPLLDPERRALHLSRAVLGFDDELADQLEWLASGAQRRGGLSAAAAFLQRAAELTEDPARRAERYIATARAKLEAGSAQAAADALSRVDEGDLSEMSRARVELLRLEVQAAGWTARGVETRMLAVAQRLGPHDPALARRTYLEALDRALYAGRLAAEGTLEAIARACRDAPPPTTRPRGMDFLLDGLGMLYTEGHTAAAPTLRRALSSLRRERDIRWFGIGVRTAFELWDDEAAFTLAANQVNVARRTGALGLLPLALNYLAVVQGAHGGQLALGDELADEATSIAAAIGAVERRYGALILAAWRGDQATATSMIAEALADATTRGEGSLITLSELCTAILHNGLGNYEQARAAASEVCARNELGYCTALPELVEAAVRSGDAESGGHAAAVLRERTRGSAADWGTGMTALCEALVQRGRDADELYEEAISRLARTRGHAHVARARLLYGESLRRDGRRSQAREQLRLAHEKFVKMGAVGFAARAHSELEATGEHVRRRTHETRDELTTQEARIARLARDGHSNPSIASQLFISRRTVEYHLHNVFRKLGIRSRVELQRVLPANDGEASAAGSSPLPAER